jgi:two-component system, NtrC family, sensor histidine kinase KinB
MTDTANSASLHLLYNVSRELTSDLELRTVLSRVLSLSSKNLGAERASVIVLDERQQPVDGALIVPDHLYSHTIEQLRGTLERGLAGWVVRNRQPALVIDSSQDERWQQRPDDAVERSGAKSAICVPVNARDQVVGVITLVHPSPNFFNQEHLILLSAIADQAGIAIYNARLHGDLQATHRRYQELFNDSIDPIFITGWDGLVLEANRQASNLSGFKPNSGQTMKMEDLLGLEIEWIVSHNQELQEGTMVRIESSLHSSDGSFIPVEAYIRKVNIEGEDALQWILRDISERKQLDTLRDTLTESIVHDLRAPLSNVISSLEFLNMFMPTEDNDNLREVLSIATRSAGRVFRLITSLLDINRLETPESILENKWEEVTPLIYEATDVIQPNVDGKKLTLKVNIPPGLPKLWIDRDMIVRVLINLLDNAVKYTANEKLIQLDVVRLPDTIQFSIKDEGPGIPEHEQEAVFDKFYRLRSEQKKTGFGLGLAFCKLAVEAHNGRIWAESNPGEGSCFFFQLPIKPVD